MNWSVERYTEWVLRHRWWVIAVSVAASLLLASGLQYVRLSNDYRYFFSEDNPHLLAFEQFERTYSSPDNILIVLQPATGLATDRANLSTVQEITELSWQIPYAVRVDSITNFQHVRAVNDDIVIRDLVYNLDTVISDEVRSIVSSEPATARMLLSNDARTTAVLVTVKFPLDDSDAAIVSASAARDMLVDLRLNHPNVRFELTGSAMLAAAFFETNVQDTGTLTPLMYVLLLIVVYLLVRSAAAVLVTMLVIALSTAGALGLFMGWLGVVLSGPTVSAPTIILTIAVADSIHILVGILIEMRNGRTKHNAIVESMRLNWQPVMLTSLTTAIGFLSQNFSDAPPFNDLGNVTAIGVLIAWGLSITLLPALISVLPVKSRSIISSQSQAMNSVAEFVLGNRRPILIGTTLVVIASALAIPQFRFNDNFVEYFDKQSEFRSATEWATEHVAGILQIHYSLPAGEPGGIANPEYLNELDEFAKWYRGQSDVVHVSSFSDIIKRVNKSMHADNPSYYAIPEDRELAAQYLLLYEMSVPYGLDVNDQVDVDKSATRLTVTFQNWETERLETQLTHAQKWFDEHAPALTAPATGIGIMFTFIGKNNYEDMKIGTVLAFMLISAVVMLALRNIKLGLVSILTNFAPPIVALGLLALFTTEVGLWANVFIVTSLGLIVDATVHFLFKYNYARVENRLHPQDAVRYTFAAVGAPLLVTSLILIMGFCVLALSTFVPNTMLGALVSTTIAVALALDFLLLPALLISIDRTTQESVPRIDSSVQGINS